MPRYAIKTTVDITRSNPARDDADSVRQGQQSNFNTLIQGIGMRANVSWSTDPYRIVHEGEAEWLWEFETEQIDVFLKDGDPVGLLKEDLDGIPIIGNLSNTTRFDRAVFTASSDRQNIWINIIA